MELNIAISIVINYHDISQYRYYRSALIKAFKRKAGLGYRLTCLWTISSIMLFKTVIRTTKELKHKTILRLSNIVCVAMWCLVMLWDSNYSQQDSDSF